LSGRWMRVLVMGTTDRAMDAAGPNKPPKARPEPYRSPVARRNPRRR
jgi:hypothetical protein